MEILNLFSTPVYKTSLDFKKEKMIGYALKSKQINMGRMLSNSGGWQSNPLIDKIDLFDDILEHVNKFSQELNIKTKQKFNQIWLNINEYKDFNKPQAFHDLPVTRSGGLAIIISLSIFLKSLGNFTTAS